MAKGGGRAVTNLLRLSGILYAVFGAYHVLRYFARDQYDLIRFHLTYFGSLIVGIMLLVLSLACFKSAGK